MAVQDLDAHRTEDGSNRGRRRRLYPTIVGGIAFQNMAR
jgi:hypothetical protein